MKYLKELLLALSLLTRYPDYLERLSAIGLSAPLLLYAGVFGVLVLALLFTAYIRQRLLRYAFALVFFSSAVFFDIYSSVTATYLTYSAFISMVYSGGFIQEAIYQYHSIILAAVGRGLLLLLGIGLAPRHKLPRIPAYMPELAPIMGLLLLTTILFVRSGEGARGLPSMFTPLAYLNLLAYETVHDTVGPREPVKLRRIGPGVDHDVVLIIDESVTGNYLDLNTKYGVKSNLNTPHPEVSIYNYGYAASISNCSTDTNVTLRYGGTRADYLKMNSTLPSLWQYARNAGLGTVYVDAQRTAGNLQNLMTELERQDIDEFVQFDNVSVLDRDMAAAKKLIELINDGKPQLIVINKVGAHFPVHDKFPDEFMVYRPTLPRGNFTEIAETGERAGFGGQADDWALYRNAYKNTLLWNVGEFFARVLNQADLSNAVMIYTSDHGQDLHERGNPGLNTHCDSDPVEEEGLVPLVVIQGSAIKGPDWQAQLAANKNRSSHYNIFPTLLQLMGYDPVAIEPVYGRSLAEKTEDDFTFNTRFNARLGAKPVWKHIDLNQVVKPSPPDSGLAKGE